MCSNKGKETSGSGEMTERFEQETALVRCSTLLTYTYW